MSCCSEQDFERHPDPDVADIGKHRGVEYTVGRCQSCGAVLIHAWAGGVAGGIGVAFQELIDRLMASAPASRGKLLSDWFERE